MPTRTERLREAIKNIADSDAAERQRQGLQDVPVGSSQNPSTKILTVANVITFCRLALTLVFLVLFIRHEHRVAALACYAVAAVTDFLDGQIARRTQTVSWLGKIMDPVMDRVLLFTGVLGLLFNGELPLWVPVFVIGRDVYLAIGGADAPFGQKRGQGRGPVAVHLLVLAEGQDDAPARALPAGEQVLYGLELGHEHVLDVQCPPCPRSTRRRSFPRRGHAPSAPRCPRPREPRPGGL